MVLDAHASQLVLQLADDASGNAPSLAADIEVVFPEADIFGVKLVNNRPTKAIVEFTNHEDTAIQVAFLAGTLSKTEELPVDAPVTDAILRNLTMARYDLSIEPGEKKAVPYSFVLDMHPRDVRLALQAVIANAKGDIFQVQAYDGTAAVVDPPTSFLDPQM